MTIKSAEVGGNQTMGTSIDFICLAGAWTNHVAISVLFTHRQVRDFSFIYMCC